MSKRPSTTDHDQSVTEPGDGDPFLSRWARRKRVARAGGDPDAQQPEKSLDGELPAGAAPSAGEQPLGGDQRPPAELTDEDMPAVDSIDESTDMSGFFSSKVSAAVKKAALRKFFHSPAFNVVDGLDDYDDDFRNFAALGDIITSDMRSQMEREAEAARESLSEDGQAGDTPAAQAPPAEHVGEADESPETVDESRDGRGRAKHDCRDAGGRAMHGAIAEDARADEDSAPRKSAGAEPDEPGVTRDPGRQAKAGPGKLRLKGAADNDA
ncbi:MAG: hypothetical protein BMS9Abin01_1600 [Gammaproteobacteria bacterium]|nr:MAG: hypothetical protein BMS9Abin01_1600 [Gammaproteobacteria bacterium]